MSRHDESADDAAASALGRIARQLDGAASSAEDAAGRERVLIALDAGHRARPRWLLTASRRRFAAARRLLPSVAALVIGAGAAAALLLLQPRKLQYRVSGSSLQIEGDWLGVAPDRGAGLLRFSEGTEIELGPGTKSRVTDLTPHGARVVLGSGALRARVVHRAHTRWSVGAGPYSIEVTGTAFDVDWSTRGARLEVRLHNGSVIVRGPSLHEGIRLAAGQRLVAHAQSGDAELSSLSTPQPASAAAPAQPALETLRPQPSAPARPVSSWSDLLTSGNFRGVLAAAQARGIDASLRRGTLADLVALSDAARYAGDRELARRGLSMQRTRFGHTPEAHAAAFVLGRMADDDGAQDEALRWYDVYLKQSPHGAFAAEALGRKLVVVVHQGDPSATEAAAKLYLQRFAHGAHAAYAREVLQRP